MLGRVKGPRCVVGPKKIWNDIVVSDFQCVNITCAYHDVQNKPAWQDKTCATHT